MDGVALQTERTTRAARTPLCSLEVGASASPPDLWGSGEPLLEPIFCVTAHLSFGCAVCAHTCRVRLSECEEGLRAGASRKRNCRSFVVQCLRVICCHLSPVHSIVSLCRSHPNVLRIHSPNSEPNSECYLHMLGKVLLAFFFFFLRQILL